jgi:hypothetical protein
MVNQTDVNHATAGTLAQDAAVTPESVIESLRELRAQIPNYVQLPLPIAATLRSVSALNGEFTQAAISAVGASETVQATVGQTSDQMQAEVDAIARWSVVRDELKATLDGVTSAVLTMKHTLGQSALLAYTVSKKLVRAPKHADLLPHVALMRKTNRLGRSRKVQTQTPAPAPAPNPAPAPPPVIHV